MNSKMLTNKEEVAFFSVLGAILLIFLILSYILGHRSPNDNLAQGPGSPLTIQAIPISAKAAYVYDTLTHTVIYQKNADARLPLASITKLMSALVATDLADPAKPITITSAAVATEGNSGLSPGERWTLRDLLDFTLVNSSNDGIRAIALSLGNLDEFVHRMNLKADELGMKNTYFLNDTGLDISTSQGGAYGSARDMAILFEYILKTRPWIFEATREPAIDFKSLDGIEHMAVNTDLIINNIPGLIASKTGFTDLAGGNLVIAYDPEIGRTIIISLLGSSEEGRFDDMVALVHASLDSVKNSVISKK